MTPRRIDVNPQFMSMTVTESAANTYTEAYAVTPVSTQLANGKAMVMEILKIFLTTGHPELIASTITQLEVSLLKKTQGTTAPTPDKSDLILYQNKVCQAVGARTNEATGVRYSLSNEQYDLTDGSGNGYLFGLTEIRLGIKGSNNATAKSAQVKILYRLKEVSAPELLGIIQG